MDSSPAWTYVSGPIKDWTWQYADVTGGPVTIYSHSGWGRPSFSEVYGCRGATPDEAITNYMKVREIAGRYAD